jgi:hypothetical protein
MARDLEDTFFKELQKLYKSKLLSSDAYMFALEQERFKNKQRFVNIFKKPELPSFSLN